VHKRRACGAAARTASLLPIAAPHRCLSLSLALAVLQTAPQPPARADAAAAYSRRLQRRPARRRSVRGGRRGESSSCSRHTMIPKGAFLRVVDNSGARLGQVWRGGIQIITGFSKDAGLLAPAVAQRAHAAGGPRTAPPARTAPPPDARPTPPHRAPHRARSSGRALRAAPRLALWSRSPSRRPRAARSRPGR
jgi:hypothetical protein